MKSFIEFKESKGGAKAGKLELIKINLDKAKAFAEDIFKKNNIDCVIHFAALKSVSESVQYPEKYFYNKLWAPCTILKNKYVSSHFQFAFMIPCVEGGIS